MVKADVPSQVAHVGAACQRFVRARPQVGKTYEKKLRCSYIHMCVQNQLGFLIILFDILLDVDFSRTVMLRSEFSSNINRIRAFDGMDPSHVRLMCSGRPRLRSRSVQGLFWHILFTCGGFIFSVLVSEGAPNLRASRRVLA